MCGTTDHSIQIPPPPTILRSLNAITINDNKNITIAKPKTPKRASSSLPSKAQRKKVVVSEPRKLK